jgi:plastocyanin
MFRPMARACAGALVSVALAGAARAGVVQIKIAQLAFTPAQVSAQVGDTIEWVNTDFIAHTATARNGAWDVVIPPNASKSIVVKAGGTVDYYCRFHPNMTGSISVAQ